MEKRLKLETIELEGGTQPRETLDLAYVAELAENIRELPPPIVFGDGSQYWLADGFHRYHAHKKAGATYIDVDLKKGTNRDAILFSVGINAKHGLKRSTADKRRAVVTLLDDEEWGQRSVKWMAEACNVSHAFVDGIRKERHPTSQPVQGRDGKTYAPPKRESPSAQGPARDPEDDFEAPSIVTPPPPAPSTAPADSPPWAEFNTEIESLMTDLRSIGRRMGDLLKADPIAKQLKSRYAHFYSHNGTVGAVNGMIRYLENNMPAAVADKAPGFINLSMHQARKSMGGK